MVRLQSTGPQVTVPSSISRAREALSEHLLDSACREIPLVAHLKCVFWAGMIVELFWRC